MIKVLRRIVLMLCMSFMFVSTASASALTVDGNANVIDKTNEDGKQFLTVQSRAGNIYYIIIDSQKGENNVYFLNAVDEQDLLSFATDATGNNYHLTGVEVTETTTVETTETTTVETTEETTTEQTVSRSKVSGLIGPFITIILLAGLAFYFLVVIKKKKTNKNDEKVKEDENTEYVEEDDDNEYSDFLENDDDVSDDNE